LREIDSGTGFARHQPYYVITKTDWWFGPGDTSTDTVTRSGLAIQFLSARTRLNEVQKRPSLSANPLRETSQAVTVTPMNEAEQRLRSTCCAIPRLDCGGIGEPVDRANWEFAHRLFACVTVASRPLRVEELAECRRKAHRLFSSSTV
jgi:hypothetical protein